MLIYTVWPEERTNDDPRISQPNHPDPARCAVCGAALNADGGHGPPIIKWKNDDPASDVYLHPSCTRSFISAIVRDLFEVEALGEVRRRQNEVCRLLGGKS